MSHPKPLSLSDSLAAHPAATPLNMGDALTVQHLNGQQQRVTFDLIWGDKCDRVTVRWAMAGVYDVDFQTGQLRGGKPKKKASVWRLIPADLARVHATSRRELHERHERMKTERGYS